MRILIVEDHLLFQESLARLLNDRPDMSVVGAVSSLQEALVKAWKFKPDVILMGSLLPDGTALDASRTILAELPGTKIVILTNDAQSGMIKDAIRHGAYGYLPRTVTFSQLLAYLRSIHREEAIVPV